MFVDWKTEPRFKPGGPDAGRRQDPELWISARPYEAVPSIIAEDALHCASCLLTVSSQTTDLAPPVPPSSLETMRKTSYVVTFFAVALSLLFVRTRHPVCALEFEC